MTGRNAFQIGGLKRHCMEGNTFYRSMISEFFWDTLYIKYNFKTSEGRFSGMTKSACPQMQPEALEQVTVQCVAKFLNFEGYTEMN